ncbi:hypothetical protein FA10DRAFT_58819 [Acaromyces ingoldii]|uniref:Uncharacterized protein n=1 Tax=Acaromyces ingoldii TaxID=215250 RepID=A0A316YBZ7_9BASI|nr:hypothetical protein FA10DRAFT_58819 [Acaromyces ingoldii]PWN86434.1 hypothetical protein FA10DRAFT_58819 [Acaromyces ingoldii]
MFLRYPGREKPHRLLLSVMQLNLSTRTKLLRGHRLPTSLKKPKLQHPRSPIWRPSLSRRTSKMVSAVRGDLTKLLADQRFFLERDVLDAVYTALKKELKELAHEDGRESSHVRSRSLEELLKKMQGKGYTVKYSQKRGEVFKVHLGWQEKTENHSSKTSSNGKTAQKVSGCEEDDVVKLVEAVESSLTSKGKAPACTVEKILRSEIPDLYNRTPTIRCFSHYLMHMRSIGAPIRFEQAEGRPTWIYFL